MSLTDNEEAFIRRSYIAYALVLRSAAMEGNEQASKVAVAQLDGMNAISEKMMITDDCLLNVVSKNELECTLGIIKFLYKGTTQIEKSTIQKIEKKLRQ